MWAYGTGKILLEVNVKVPLGDDKWNETAHKTSDMEQSVSFWVTFIPQRFILCRACPEVDVSSDNVQVRISSTSLNLLWEERGGSGHGPARFLLRRCFFRQLLLRKVLKGNMFISPPNSKDSLFHSFFLLRLLLRLYAQFIIWRETWGKKKLVA